MILDLFKKKNYSQFRSITFIRDWLMAVIITSVVWDALLVGYSFYLWQHPLNCIDRTFYLGSIRIIVLVMFFVALFFNRKSHAGFK